MPAKRINQIIKDLPFERKLLGIGAFLMAISTFMPWYQDVDSFKTGDVFLGLSGPLYLAGFSILALAVADILLVFMEAAERKIPIKSVKPSTLYLASGLASFYLLLIINSVYFHNKFGVNITNKDSGFGMFMAFIAASLITIGGYLSTREKASLIKEFQEKAQESLIKIPDQNGARKPREINRPIPQPIAVPEKITQTQLAEENVMNENVMQTVAKPAVERKSYQPYRTDL